MLNRKDVAMKNQMFMRANEVAAELGVSIAYAYKLIRVLNTELQKHGYITINGRVSRQYFNEKLYGNSAVSEKGANYASI
jgi:hypothetical protein